ncbi:hypothetical protein AMTR_s00036p00145440 [Amborella trichopoda]|uniref:Uncharacterized protein n=1 Tax=Amborella trichopoda TaxID=13333 RepID=U5D1S2_AMBTC|nr:hypothetical protein AMTR_s00036p00145440 [Amborella trichopoda]
MHCKSLGPSRHDVRSHPSRGFSRQHFLRQNSSKTGVSHPMSVLHKNRPRSGSTHQGAFRGNIFRGKIHQRPGSVMPCRFFTRITWDRESVIPCRFFCKGRNHPTSGSSRESPGIGNQSSRVGSSVKLGIARVLCIENE